MRRFKTSALLLLAIGLFMPAQAQYVWEVRNPVTQPNTLNGVTWAGDRFVAVGANNTVVSSTDGASWTSITPPSPSTTKWNAIGYSASQNLVVAVGDGGYIMTSTNRGSSWTVRRSTGDKLYGVAMSASQIVVVGANSSILTSTNGGVDWVPRVSGVTASWYAVAYSPQNSRFVAVGTSGSIIGTVDGGENWTNYTLGGGNLHSLAWTGTEFVAGGVNGRVARSATGASTWTASTTPTAGTPLLNGMAFGGEVVAVSSIGLVYTSSGTSWTAQPKITNSELGAVTYSQPLNKYLAVGAGGLIVSSTGTNGTTWKQESSIAALLTAVDSGNGVRVAVGASGAILTSTDDITWTPRLSPTTKNLNAVTWNGNGFTAVGDGGVVINSNASGDTWTEGASGVTYNLASIAWINVNAISRLVAGSSAENLPITSTNGGVSWTNYTSTSSVNNLIMNGFATNAGSSSQPATATLIGVGYNVGAGVASLRRATVTTNPAIVSFTNISQTSTASLNAVAWVGTRYIAVGGNSLILSSADGNTWTPETSPITGRSLWSVSRAGNLAVITGSGGLVMTSPIVAGSPWEVRTTGTNVALYGSTWGGSQLTAVGAGGTILTSSPTAVPAAPSLTSPAANQTGVMVSPILSWTTPIGASSYNVQISTSSTFSSLLVDATVSAPPYQVPVALAVNTTHYWRVRSNGTTGSSAFSATGTFTVVDAAGSAPTISSPANNAVGVSTFTSLNWNAYTPAATGYHVQFSKFSDFSVMLLNDSTSITGTTRTLAELESDVPYYWRVKAITSVGRSAWSATATFRTAPPLPGIPTLTSPANGTSGNVTSQALAWTAPSGTVSSYRLQVSTNSTFSGTLFFDDSTLTGTSRTVTGLAANTEYHWRVRAKNAAGSGEYSTARTFSTWSSAPVATPLASPANNAANVNVFTDFRWSANSSASSLRLQVAFDTTFTTKVFDSLVTGTSKNIGQLANLTKYYWRIVAANPVGTTNSARWTFTTGSAPTTPPAAPALLLPGAFASNQAVTGVTLSWDSSATATHYRVSVATTPTFAAGSVVLVDSTLTARNKVVSGLLGSTDYYWKVNARNNVGWSADGEVRNFRTIVVAPAGTPTPLLPEIYSTGVSNTPLFTWTSVPGATSYKLQISLQPDFASLVRNDSNITDTARTSPALAHSTTYYWRVQARNTAGAGSYSLIMRFTTRAAPVPGAFSLIYPGVFQTQIPVAPTFKWGRSRDATSYRLQVCATVDLTPPCAVNDSSITDTVKAVTGLTLGASYFWRVTSKNTAGTAQTDVWRFTVTNDPNSAILFGRVGMRDGLHARGGELRFGLVQRETVQLRFLDIRGRELMPSVTRVMDGGYHAVKLPAELHGMFYFVRFEAGPAHAMVKVHP